MITNQQVINAVATQLDTAHAGYWPGLDGTYPKTPPRTPIYAKRLPAAQTTALAVNVYQVDRSPDPAQTLIVAHVQVRARAPLDADQAADTALHALHGHHHEQWGDLQVQRCRQTSQAQLGADSAGLDERTDNYELEILT